VHQFGIAYTPEQPYTGFWGMSKRSVFVVDRDGVVRYAWVTDDPAVAPDVEAVLRAVEALQWTGVCQPEVRSPKSGTGGWSSGAAPRPRHSTSGFGLRA
jgi:alkyl hydroperoxide reductase subunit AhpC